MSEERFDRSTRFFGKVGQQRIRQTSLAIAGCGGIGSIAIQHAALLGFGRLSLIDPGELKSSSRNRYVTARHDDPIPGTKKVDIAKRLVHSIDSSIQVDVYPTSAISDAGFIAIENSDFVLGCLDQEGFRLLLLQASAIFRKPYVDMATQILSDELTLRYGGRVCCSYFGHGCLSCLDILDTTEANRDLAGDAERKHREALYGVDSEFLGDSGPSVSPLNGTIASLGVMELMAHVAGLREPHPHLNYDGRSGKVGIRAERITKDCYYCNGLFTGKLHGNPAELIRAAGNIRLPLS